MQGLEEIYNSYSKLVFNLALQYVQNKEDAEEITQDTFITIHQSMDKFRNESDISTWIYRIAINKSLDFLKAKKRKKRFALFTGLFNSAKDELHHDSKVFDHPGVLYEQKETLKNIFDQINSLPEKQRTALILSKIEQKSQKEISQIMQISPKAVESLIQRAKTTLAKKLMMTEGK
jgi:RNA polymerase sigma factor (sigma-70 family)